MSRRSFLLREAATLLTNPIKGKLPLGLVSKRPYIFLTSLYLNAQYSIGSLNPLAFALSQFRVTWMFICTWQITIESATRLKNWIERFNKRFPRHRIIILANTGEELEVLKSFAIDTILCNHNSFIDEAIFKPLDCDKVYDAVYDGRLSPYKRIELASEIERLAIISYAGSGWTDREYGTKLISQMQNADWINKDSDFHFNWMNPVEVNRILNKSHVGLCLSQVEGAMYASIQYLLAGLPVVTTYNLGGRDEFFDPEYVEWVEDNPKAVEAGVDKLIKKNIDPHYIRSRTLEKIVDHRRRFIALIQSIYDKNNILRDFESEWPKIFFNKMQDGSLTWTKVFGRNTF